MGTFVETRTSTWRRRTLAVAAVAAIASAASCAQNERDLFFGAGEIADGGSSGSFATPDAATPEPSDEASTPLALCVSSECPAPYATCPSFTGLPRYKCSINLLTDRENCGSCGNSCAVQAPLPDGALELQRRHRRWLRDRSPHRREELRRLRARMCSRRRVHRRRVRVSAGPGRLQRKMRRPHFGRRELWCLWLRLRSESARRRHAAGSHVLRMRQRHVPHPEVPGRMGRLQRRSLRRLRGVSDGQRRQRLQRSEQLRRVRHRLRTEREVLRGLRPERHQMSVPDRSDRLRCRHVRQSPD